jgi:hypothetical protein
VSRRGPDLRVRVKPVGPFRTLDSAVRADQEKFPEGDDGMLFTVSFGWKAIAAVVAIFINTFLTIVYALTNHYG